MSRSSSRQRLSPLYHQVYIQLRQMIVEGALDQAAPLPSEIALAERYGVSRVTIRKTLDALSAEGLVRRVHGVGTFPAPPQDRASRANISGLLENLISFEAGTTAVNLEWTVGAVPSELVPHFGDGTCLRIRRLRSYQGRPISYTLIHVPGRLAAGLDEDEVGDEPIARALERRGVIAEQAEQTITAIAAEPDVAMRLEVAPRAPLIVMRRLMLDAARGPVLHQESCYAPERFEYRMTLSRMTVGNTARWTPIA